MHENVNLFLHALVFATAASGFLCLVVALYYSFRLGEIAKRILMPFFVTPFMISDDSLDEEGVTFKRNARLYYMRFLVLIVVAALLLLLGLKSIENLTQSFDRDDGEIHFSK